MKFDPSKLTIIRDTREQDGFDTWIIGWRIVPCLLRIIPWSAWKITFGLSEKVFQT